MDSTTAPIHDSTILPELTVFLILSELSMEAVSSFLTLSLNFLSLIDKSLVLLKESNI